VTPGGGDTERKKKGGGSGGVRKKRWVNSFRYSGDDTTEREGTRGRGNGGTDVGTGNPDLKSKGNVATKKEKAGSIKGWPSVHRGVMCPLLEGGGGMLGKSVGPCRGDHGEV